MFVLMKTVDRDHSGHVILGIYTDFERAVQETMKAEERLEDCDPSACEFTIQLFEHAADTAVDLHAQHWADSGRKPAFNTSRPIHTSLLSHYTTYENYNKLSSTLDNPASTTHVNSDRHDFLRRAL